MKVGVLPPNNFAVENVSYTVNKEVYSAGIPGYPHFFQRDLGSRSKQLSLTIALIADENYSLATLNNMLTAMIETAEAVVVDLTDVYPGVFGVGFVRRSPPSLELPTFTRTGLEVDLLPPWGFTVLNEGNARLWDLDRMGVGSRLDPTVVNSKFIVNWNSGPKTISYEMIVDHEGASAGWVKLELFIPDALAAEKARIYSWNGAAYVLFADYGATPSYTSGNLYYLDGQTATTKWGSGLGARLYDVASLNAVGNPLAGDSAAGAMTYSGMFGTSKRIGIAIKFPASTMSRSLSGSGAADKVRLKIVFYFNDEYTTYQSLPSTTAPPLTPGETKRGPLSILAADSTADGVILRLMDYTGLKTFYEWRNNGGLYLIDKAGYVPSPPSGDTTIIYKNPADGITYVRKVVANLMRDLRVV